MGGLVKTRIKIINKNRLESSYNNKIKIKKPCKVKKKDLARREREREKSSVRIAPSKPYGFLPSPFVVEAKGLVFPLTILRPHV